MYICMYVCMYVCTYVCMYARTYMCVCVLGSFTWLLNVTFSTVAHSKIYANSTIKRLLYIILEYIFRVKFNLVYLPYQIPS